MLAAQQYLKAYRAESMDLAIQSARFAHIASTQGEPWPVTEAAIRENILRLGER